MRMNADSFLKEVLGSDSCPGGFEQMYADFQGYQRAAMQTLLEFHRVCELNGVRYQLAYGSLLGAIRDGGQIPWDYDIDVFVPYCEKDKLIAALRKDLGEGFYFYCPEADPKCRHYMMRVTPKGMRSEGLHVDVFYIIGAPDEGVKAFGEACFDVFQARYDKLVNAREECMGNARRYARLLVNKFRRLPMTLEKLDAACADLCSRYDLWQSQNCISFDDESAKYVYRTDLLWDTMLFETRDGVFRITKNYDDVLRRVYGDYTSVPSLEGRIGEMMRTMKRLKYYEAR